MEQFQELYSPWSIRLPILVIWVAIALFAGLDVTTWIGLALPWLLVWFLVLFRGQIRLSLTNTLGLWVLWLAALGLNQLTLNSTGSILAGGSQVLELLVLAALFGALVMVEDIGASRVVTA